MHYMCTLQYMQAAIDAMAVVQDAGVRTSMDGRGRALSRVGRACRCQPGFAGDVSGAWARGRAAHATRISDAERTANAGELCVTPRLPPAPPELAIFPDLHNGAAWTNAAPSP